MWLGINIPLFHIPNFLKKQLHDCIDKQAPYIEQFLEEGKRYGSLSVQYPKQAAETWYLGMNKALKSPAPETAIRQYRLTGFKR